MVKVSVAETGELSECDLASAEALVRSSFGAQFRAHDWLHGLGGAHVLASDNGALLAHAAVVARTLRHENTVLATGYVEGVAVRVDQQGRGLGRIVMDHAEAIIQARHDIGALNAVQRAVRFYAHRGWQLWAGPTQADTPTGTIDTYDPADLIYLWTPTAAPLVATAPLICDWRIGDLW